MDSRIKESSNHEQHNIHPQATPTGTVAGYFGHAPMNPSAIKGRKLTPAELKRRREGGLCIYCGDSRHFAASCPRKLKAVSGHVEVIPLWDTGKGKEEEKSVEKEV
jgi:hypothetical protein